MVPRQGHIQAVKENPTTPPKSPWRNIFETKKNLL
jgi:hypothetical protein